MLRNPQLMDLRHLPNFKQKTLARMRQNAKKFIQNQQKWIWSAKQKTHKILMLPFLVILKIMQISSD